MPRLTLITGESGSGKTTFLLKELSAASPFVGQEEADKKDGRLCEDSDVTVGTGVSCHVLPAKCDKKPRPHLSHQSLHTVCRPFCQCVGVITPAVFEAGEKTGIEAWLLSGQLETAERILLARRRDLAESIPDGDTGLGWVFDQGAINRVNAHLAILREKDASVPATLVIDELGPLELIHGKGFTAALELLDVAVFQEVKAVVRPALIERAKKRWKDSYCSIEVIEL